MLKGLDLENQTIEEKINTNGKNTQINNLGKENILAAINQAQTKEIKPKIADNFDLTNEKNSSSDEWKEEKSNSKDMLKKKRNRTSDRPSRPKPKVILKKVEESNDDEKFNYNINSHNNFMAFDNRFEKEALAQLIKVEGFNKVFRLISKPFFNRKNPLERKIDEIVCNIGLLRTSLILLQIKFDLYDNSGNSNISHSFNTPNLNNGYSNNNLYNSYSNSFPTQLGQSTPVPLSLSSPKMKNNYSSNDIDGDISLDEKEDGDRLNESRYQKFQGQKEILKDGYELGEHLHKEPDGKIYKYLKHHLRVTKGFVFNCADRKCKSKGLYDTETMNFKIIIKHTIPHDEHNYIVNKDKFNQYKTIFDDFIKRECNEAQVFKNDVGNKLVKWYNN